MNRRKKFGKLATFTVVACVGATVTGCGGFQLAQNSWEYNSSWNNFVMKHRNQGWSTKAWHRRKHAFCNEQHLGDFCNGFTAGYLAVADGGDGCTPPFAPREYWGWQYQSPEGQQKVAAWFSGFPHGARAAEEDGIGNWTQIQTSYQVQQEYNQAGLLAPNQHPGMYPMPEPVAPGQAALRASPIAPDAAPATIPLDINATDKVKAEELPATPPVPQPDHSSGLPQDNRLLR